MTAGQPGPRKPDPRVTSEDVYSAVGAYTIVAMNGGIGHDCMRAALETTLEPTGLVGRAIAAELERIADEDDAHYAASPFGRMEDDAVGPSPDELRAIATAWREGRR